MSAIKSVIPGSSQFLEIDPTLAEGVTAVAVSSPSGTYTKPISVSTHDLRKALGIDELGCGCYEADENLKAAIRRAEDAEAFGAAAVTRAEEAEGDAREWKARAEKAEAKLAEAAQPAIEYVEGQGYTLDYRDIERHAIRLAVRDLEVLGIAHKQLVADKHAAERHAEQHQHNRDLALKGRNEAQERAEVARAKAVALAAERAHWQDRAEKAEAAIQRVREVRNEWSKTLGRSGHVVEIDAALADRPAFALPTEAGARFTAQGNDDKPGSRTSFLTLVGGGRVVYMAVDDVRCVYEAAGVMEHYTDHRLA